MAAVGLPVWAFLFVRDLFTGTARTEAGRARLRKFVVTENVTQTVPVTREEVRLETDVEEDRFTDPGDQSRRG